MAEINWTELITKAYWPLLALFIVVIYRQSLEYILKKRELKFMLPNGVTATISSADAEATLNELFTEFYINYNTLVKTEQKKIFTDIVALERVVRVKELIPSFDRDNINHKGTLRALRGLGLIEPAGGGSWDPESIVLVTKFGRIFTKYLDFKQIT